MEYRGYNNFSEFAVDKIESVTSLGFGVMDFIGDHTLGIGIAVVILFLLYKFFVEPIIGKQDLKGLTDFDPLEGYEQPGLSQ